MARRSFLSEAQETVITGILSGLTQKAAAEAAGVDPSTVSRWLSEPMSLINMELSDRRLALRALTAVHMSRMTAKAAAVLEDAMDSENEAVRVKAALAVLKAANLA